MEWYDVCVRASCRCSPLRLCIFGRPVCVAVVTAGWSGLAAPDDAASFAFAATSSIPGDWMVLFLLMGPLTGGMGTVPGAFVEDAVVPLVDAGLLAAILASRSGSVKCSRCQVRSGPSHTHCTVFWAGDVCNSPAAATQ